MRYVSNPDLVVRILSGILFVLFIISVAYIWIQMGHYHGDTNSLHIHTSVHKNVESLE